MNLDYGRVLAMPVSDKHQGSYAVFTSAYFYVSTSQKGYDNYLIEIYYWIETDLAPPIISVGLILENKTEMALFVDSKSTLSGWRLTPVKFIPITGVYQLFVKGQRSLIGSSGLFVDDIYFTPANGIGRFGCLSSSSSRR